MTVAADYEFLNDESIVQLIIGGNRHHDTYVRALLAGVPKEKIIHMQDECEASEVISDEADTVFVLHDVYTIRSANIIRQKLEAKEKEAAK